MCDVLMNVGFTTADVADEKTGIVTGLGVSAALGKTTLGDRAGSIEAALLDSDSILKAGQVIHTISAARRNGCDILVLGRGDTVDYTTALWLAHCIGQLHTMAGKVPACTAIVVPPNVWSKMLDGGTEEAARAAPRFGFARTDIAAALTTEVSVGKMALGTEDLPLINAVLMSGTQPDWLAASQPITSAANASNYLTLRN